MPATRTVGSSARTVAGTHKSETMRMMRFIGEFAGSEWMSLSGAGRSWDGQTYDLQVVDAEAFVGDEEDSGVAGGGGTVLHRFTFGEPDEVAGAKGAFVGDELTFEDVHAVAARVRVERIDDAGGVANDTDLHAVFGIGIEAF